MTQAEMKRRVGYVQPDFKETCGTCRNCKRRGCHLRCAKWDFAVVADGICRNGYEKPDAPLNDRETPLLTFKQDLIDHIDGLVADGIRIVPATAEDISGVRVTPMLTHRPEVCHAVERAFIFGEPVPKMIWYDPALNSAVRNAGHDTEEVQS